MFAIGRIWGSWPQDLLIRSETQRPPLVSSNLWAPSACNPAPDPWPTSASLLQLHAGATCALENKPLVHLLHLIHKAFTDNKLGSTKCVLCVWPSIWILDPAIVKWRRWIHLIGSKSELDPWQLVNVSHPTPPEQPQHTEQRAQFG